VSVEPQDICGGLRLRSLRPAADDAAIARPESDIYLTRAEGNHGNERKRLVLVGSGGLVLVGSGGVLVGFWWGSGWVLVGSGGLVLVGSGGFWLVGFGWFWWCSGGFWWVGSGWYAP